jgi:hypothetical protein
MSTLLSSILFGLFSYVLTTLQRIDARMLFSVDHAVATPDTSTQATAHDGIGRTVHRITTSQVPVPGGIVCLITQFGIYLPKTVM